MRPLLLLFLASVVWLVASCGKSESAKKDPLTVLGERFGLKEVELLGKIRSAASAAERERYLVELEAEPEKNHPFYSRWLLIHDAFADECWTDEGYNAALSRVPRDIQLLAATCYGISDIENGGLHQFFGNSTGVVAPEMKEWFERAGMPEAAKVLQEAIDAFGGRYSRSQGARQEFLDTFKGGRREEWDPFFKLDERFGDAMTGGGAVTGLTAGRFNTAANKWLREVCGISDLRMTYKSVSAREGAASPDRSQ